MKSIQQKSFILLIILSLPFILQSCGGDKTPDVSDITVELESQRLDKDLYALDTNNLGAGLAALHSKYPEFLNFYLDTIMGFSINGNYTDSNPGVQKGLKTFLTHKDYRGVFDTVMARYPDETKINETLTKGFKYVKHYFPGYNEPRIIYLVSGLNNYGALTYDEDVLGIGLDMFLGAEYPYYKSVGIPEYFSRQLNENYIPVAVMRTVYRQDHPFTIDGKVLLDMMIQSGKEMYYLGKVLPFTEEHVRLAYTPQQLQWCEENEAMVYDFFVRKELFYENNLQKVVRYVMDGPSATGMPAESPGNIGAWMGLQIVEAYMKEHPDMTLQQLADAPIDAQRFLLESKYKPR